MNRKKKRDSILRKRRKQESAKLAPKSKPRYISKADREALHIEEQGKTDSQVSTS